MLGVSYFVQSMPCCRKKCSQFRSIQRSCHWEDQADEWHQIYNRDVIMGAIASQITSLTIVCTTVYSDGDKRKHQSSASLAFVRGIHRGQVNSPHKWPVTRKKVSIWWRHHVPHIYNRGLFHYPTRHFNARYKTLSWSNCQWFYKRKPIVKFNLNFIAAARNWVIRSIHWFA